MFSPGQRSESACSQEAHMMESKWASLRSGMLSSTSFTRLSVQSRKSHTQTGPHQQPQVSPKVARHLSYLCGPGLLLTKGFVF